MEFPNFCFSELESEGIELFRFVHDFTPDEQFRSIYHHLNCLQYSLMREEGRILQLRKLDYVCKLHFTAFNNSKIVVKIKIICRKT